MAEQRLIDAKALWKNVDKLPSVLDANNGWLVKKTSVLAKIEDATVVEPKPVIHAHWNIVVDKGDPESFPEDLEYPQCSNPKCGKISLVKSDYCPHCGAQMDEEINNEIF